MNILQKAQGQFWILLTTLLILFLVTPAMRELPGGNSIVTASFILVLLVTVYEIWHNKKIIVISCILAAIALLFEIINLIHSNEITMMLNNITLLIFFVYAVKELFSAVMGSKKITRQVIFGAASIYLLIAVGFSLIYQVIMIITPDALIYAINSKPADSSDLLYYSMITLTVGYGDIIPAAPYARTVAMLEGAAGVLYLATLVARLVSGLSAPR